MEKMIADKARATGKSKSEILMDVIQRATKQESSTLSPEEAYQHFRRLPEPREESMSRRLYDYVEMMFLSRIAEAMGGQGGKAAVGSAGEDIKTIYLLKELTKPSIYELMMMQRLESGQTGEPPKWLQAMADEQKETRELLKKMVGLKEEEERFSKFVEPIVTEMTKDREAMKENYNKILGYISRGEGAGEGSLEAYIAAGIKERLMDEVMDAIDKGLFHKREITTPSGEMDWKGVLDRMLNIGEEVVKKMPRQAPPVQAVRTLSGQYVHPATGQVLTPEQVQQMRAMQQQAPAAPPAEQPQAPAPSQGRPPTKEEEEAILKEKTSEAVDTFMKAGEQSGSGEEEAKE